MYLLRTQYPKHTGRPLIIPPPCHAAVSRPIESAASSPAAALAWPGDLEPGAALAA